MDETDKQMQTVQVEVVEGRGKGRPRFEFTEKDIKYIHNMASHGFPIDVIAGILGIGPATLERRMRDDQRIYDAVHQGRSKAYGKIQEIAFKMAANDKNERMTIYLLEKWDHTLKEMKQSGEIKDVNIKNDKVITKQRLLEAIKNDPFIETEEDNNED